MPTILEKAIHLIPTGNRPLDDDEIARQAGFVRVKVNQGANSAFQPIQRRRPVFVHGVALDGL